MNCEYILDRFASLDKYESMPINIKIHLIHCKKCRTIITKMSMAESVQLQILNESVDNNTRMLDATMQRILRLQNHRSAQEQQKEEPALISWLIAGLILVLGFIIVPFSDIGKMGMQQFGTAFSIPFALLCAGSIVAYSAVFIAKNIVFFTEKLNIG